jgi:molybdate transport system substrate-binding protein
VSDGAQVLRDGDFTHLAIAEAGAAPYGAAAMGALDALGLAAAIKPKVVTGENISQTLQFVDSGNAELGFVALSQVIGKPADQVWVVPCDLYVPIRQDAVLLRAGEQDAVARAFLDFLKGDLARGIIEKYGYRATDGSDARR